jgi:cell division protein FtsB
VVLGLSPEQAAAAIDGPRDIQLLVEVECRVCHEKAAPSCHNEAVSRSKTTSIQRPAKLPPAKEGSSRLGDVTRAIPVDKRLSRRPKVALFSGCAALAVIGTMAAAVFVLPIGTWRDQGDDLTQRQEQLDALVNVNGQLAAEVDRLQTDAGVLEAAREEIGYVMTGEERRSVLPAPPLPSDLPAGWPYNIVTEIFAARTAGPAPTTTD